MKLVKRGMRRLFTKADVIFDYAFGSGNNPLHWLGAFGWFFFWIAAGSGVYLYIFFDTGITNAYASVEYITHEQWYAAGIMRSFHRYASDALVVVTLLHLLREFAMDRLRGKRFFAWLTGVPLLGFIYICGISGYWLVWDQLAQYIAIATAEWLDTLPFFAEPIANNFLNETTLSDRFFTLLVFIHIFGPLFMLVLMWVHIQRHSNGRVNPPRPLALGTVAMLLAMSLMFPAASQGPANLDVVPANVNLDWFYLPAYPLLDVLPGGQLWLYLVMGAGLLALLPWMPPAKPKPAAVVDLEHCNGCARCFDDCPFSAISMLPRSDGSKFETEAVVNVENCVSCGGLRRRLSYFHAVSSRRPDPAGDRATGPDDLCAPSGSPGCFGALFRPDWHNGVRLRNRGRRVAAVERRGRRYHALRRHAAPLLYRLYSVKKSRGWRHGRRLRGGRLPLSPGQRLDGAAHTW